MCEELEEAACTAHRIDQNGFNRNVNLPYGLTVQDIRSAMEDFIELISIINQLLNQRGMVRLESLIMQANFSSIVGEFIVTRIPNYCDSIVKNRYHNGYPDLLPIGTYENNAAQHANEGIEVKASRHRSGWQGHNPEEGWLMVFIYDSNRPVDHEQGIEPRPFRFVAAVGARLESNDWSFSGRSETSRRTITASVIRSGCLKMNANWIYRDSELFA